MSRPPLSFIADPVHWGLPFRRGLFRIPRQDFATIVAHMAATGWGEIAVEGDAGGSILHWM
jgi:hypothetical protein